MSKGSNYPSPTGDTHLSAANANDLPDDVTEAELSEFVALLIAGDLLDDDHDDDHDGLPKVPTAWVPEGSTMRIYHRNMATISASMMTDAQLAVERFRHSSASRQPLFVQSADRLMREDPFYSCPLALMALLED